MARKKTTPEEEVNVTTAAEEPAAQVVPPTEDGMPPGNTSVSEPTADAVQSAPLSLEMPTAEEAGADETPVPAQMREPVKEPEPSEKYGVDALEKAEMPPSAPSAEESDWGFQEEQKTSAPESETPAPIKFKHFKKFLFDKKERAGIIHIAGYGCGASASTGCAKRLKQLPCLKLRFTTLYTFPPLYTQKPAARRVFVFVGAFFFFTKGCNGKQRTCPAEQLFPATTPPVKMQTRKVRRLSGFALYQNIIPLMIARAQRRLFKLDAPIRPDSPQSSADPRF